MRSGDKLQDELLARDNAKIQRKRELFEQRRQRILNAKVRLIGLDVQPLNEQVKEKERLRQEEREADRFARTQAMEIERILAASMEEERQMKEFQMNEIKKSWEAANEWKRTKESEPLPPDFDLERSGPAAALRFVGEDPNRGQRIQMQHAQMQKWVQEQIAEKAYLKHLIKEEDMSYAEMIKAIDEVREATEREEREMRQYITDTVKQYNRELALTQSQRNRNLFIFKSEDGQPVPTSLDLFNEDKALAMDERGRIIRRDMFKGFTEEQRKKILLDNQAIIQERNALTLAEKQREYDFMIQQLLAMRAMEQAEYEERAMKEQVHSDHLAFLRDQIEAQRRDRVEWDKTKYGEVRGGFFEGFGKSCR
jgi:hypothetical protein